MQLAFNMVSESPQIRGADNEGILDFPHDIIHIVGDAREDFRAKALHVGWLLECNV